MNILFCYSRIPSFTNAVRDYAEAFGRHSRHVIHYFDMDGGALDFDIARYDAIIFNYCFWGRCLTLDKVTMARIARFGGPKVAIFQDEYDYFLWHRSNVTTMGIDTIVTCVPEKHWRDVFGEQACRTITFLNALTGYVPESLLRAGAWKPLDERAWSVGYRGRPVPFEYGRLTQEKVIIGERMRQACTARGISCNIELSEEHRIYGADWATFIGNCRTVLGTESGSNVFDFDGTVKPAISAYLRRNPDADFETVHALFLADIDGRISMNQVSPRIFEAISLKTGLVLFEGAYSGVVQPWKHYIPLRKDFSNVDEVFAAIADTRRLSEMIDQAYADVIEVPTYHFKTYVARIDSYLEQRVRPTNTATFVYGAIGRREGEHFVPMRPRGMLGPTDRPLMFTDKPFDPIIAFRFDGGALRRRLFGYYERLLYSRRGKALNARLARNQHLYRPLRWVVRRLTGRRP